MNFRSVLCVLLLIGLTACAAGPEQRTLRAAGSTAELARVPFYPQQEFQCGPAALATVLVADGVDTNPEQLALEVYLPGRRGSLQAELMAATRRHGRVPYPLPHSLAPMLEQLRAGKPVLVFQNVGLARWPTWHYAVVVGYDAAHEKFLLRSGTEQRLEMRARSFFSSWDRAGRWAMVVTSPTAPPVAADAVTWLQAVAPFESTGDLANAARGYEAAVARWPRDASAWTALGNVRYRQQRLADAESAYRQALALSPQQWVARNNLVQTLVDRGCVQQAQEIVEEGGAPPPAMAAAWAQTRSGLAAGTLRECLDISGHAGNESRQ